MTHNNGLPHVRACVCARVRACMYNLRRPIRMFKCSCASMELYVLACVYDARKHCSTTTKGHAFNC